MNFDLTAAQQELVEKARALARGPVAARAAEVDRTEQYPWDTVALLRDAGFFGMTIPVAYGGQGRSYLDAVLVIEEMAQCCGITGRIVVEANMGAIGAVMAYGSEDQKRRAAALVLAGDKPAICITEPGAGSAASEMTTRADRRGNGFVVNGAKHWITGGGVSRLHLIFARVFDSAGNEEGIGGFIAVRDETPGLTIGKREPAMGLRGIPESEIRFEDMWLPADSLVLPPRGLAKGFADLMNAYNGQRIGAATVALGLAEGAYALALDYAQTREQFGRPICEFQGLQWMLADMAIQIAAAQALIYKAAARGGAGFPDVLEAAQAKIFASEMAIKVTNDALQLFGAAGYSRERPLERMVRDARMFTIGGGTAQILRTVVAARLLNRKLPQGRDGYAGERAAE
ncbi:MAG TPA: 3-sulfinopropanoyl-CoA desulfinase [Candidatus Sulfotelmatobacter sp.]|nr:3-sulfinopropanoyl-CoA desulfinase [Candidatus Sulfotelmatobacter sp.]